MGLWRQWITEQDFLLSKTQPVDLGDTNKRRGSHEAYLIGEVKLSLETFYNANVKGGKKSQFNTIMDFAEYRVYAKTAVFLALYNGEKNSNAIQSALGKLLTKEAIIRKVIPIIDSAI